jgi:hypothetical protein
VQNDLVLLSTLGVTVLVDTLDKGVVWPPSLLWILVQVPHSFM